MLKKNLYIAVLLSFIFPFAGMLNISQGIKSITYLLLSITGVFLSLGFIHFGFFAQFSVLEVIILFQFIINLIASFHCYALLKKNESQVKRKWFSKWYVRLFIIFGLYLLLILEREFISQPFNVNTEAMQPTLFKNQLVFTLNPTFFRLLQKIKHTTVNTSETADYPSKGSIIIYQYAGYAVVSRVIGQAGDSYTLIDEKVYLNGKSLIEHAKLPYLYKVIDKDFIKLQPNTYITIPDDYCLVRLDSPSLDYAGDIVTLVPIKSIVGYVKFILWDKKSRKFIGKFLD